MKFLDLTLPTPAENLACDEALLDLCEREHVEVIRFWEAREPFVVVGYGNQVTAEVNVEECRQRGIPILRRCSGGGTVLQGPGCFNYSVTLCVPGGGAAAPPGSGSDTLLPVPDGALATVTGANEFVMERNRRAMERLLGMKVSVQGHTDLAFAWGDEFPESQFENQPGTHGTRSSINWLKFSGNAQRRRRNAILFHGTILYAFDLGLIEALLRFPSAQPEYRAGRSHLKFVRNIPASADAIRDALRHEWQAQQIAAPPPQGELERLVREQYANASWNCRR